MSIWFSWKLCLATRIRFIQKVRSNRVQRSVILSCDPIRSIRNYIELNTTPRNNCYFGIECPAHLFIFVTVPISERVRNHSFSIFPPSLVQSVELDVLTTCCTFVYIAGYSTVSFNLKSVGARTLLCKILRTDLDELSQCPTREITLLRLLIWKFHTNSSY